jgi:hypothetical protein
MSTNLQVKNFGWLKNVKNSIKALGDEGGFVFLQNSS